MTIPANTRVKLNIHSPKKDAVVAQAGTSAGANDVAIYTPTGAPINKPQSIVGDLTKLHRMAQTILKDLDGTANPDVLSVPSGGSDNSIVINGVPGAGDLILEIGTYTGAGDRSHFLDRTFKRLIERWLEEAK